MKDIELSRTSEEFKVIESMSERDRDVLKVLFEQSTHLLGSQIEKMCDYSKSQILSSISKLNKNGSAEIDIEKVRVETKRATIANSYLLIKVNGIDSYKPPRETNVHITECGQILEGIRPVARFYGISKSSISYQLRRYNCDFDTAIKRAIKCSDISPSSKTGPKKGRAKPAENPPMKFVKKSRCPKPEFNMLTMGI